MAAPAIQIGTRRIATGERPYVIAEMSANHGQSFQQAVQIVQAAAAAGADAVKLQTYTPDTLTLDCDRGPFRVEGTIWDGCTLYELYRQAQTPWDWQPRLQAIARELALDFFSTPFDATAVEFLETMQVPAYKIASFELPDLALLRLVARTGKPILLSTGMATWGEIDEAVATLRGAGNTQLALLKCTSTYPARPAEMNLRTIGRLAADFGVPVGLSDHSLEIAVPVAAVALGACIIEKHLTLSRSLPSADRQFSLEPDEFRQMVQAVHVAHQSLGTVQTGPAAQEAATRRLRRSLFVVRDIPAGGQITAENVRSIRPAGGLHPRCLDHVLGRTARIDLPRGTPLRWEHLS